MSVAFLYHGFNDNRDNKDALDCLVEPLTNCFYDIHDLYGEHVVQADYGYRHRVRVRLCTEGHSKTIAAMSPKGSVAIGHSHGCSVIARALNHGARFDRVYFLNPALDSDWVFPDSLQAAYIFYNPTDLPVWWARWLPWDDWGDMGRVGYKGPSKNVFQVNMQKRFGYVGHSGHRADPEKIAQYICEKERIWVT